MVKLPGSSGFTNIELLLVITALVAIGFTGYFVERHARQSILTSSQAPTSADVRSWSTYKLQYEGATFKYPAGWKIVSSPTGYGGDGLGSQDTDSITISAPNNFNVSISEGYYSGISSCAFPKVVGSEKLIFDGGTNYLDYMSANLGSCAQEPVYNGKVSGVELSMSPSYAVPLVSKNPHYPNTANVNPLTNLNSPVPYEALNISAGYVGSNNSYVFKTVAQAKADTNYKDVLSIIESLSY